MPIPRPIIFEGEISVSKKELSDILTEKKEYGSFSQCGKTSRSTTRLVIHCIKSLEDAEDYSVFISLEQRYYGCIFYDKYYGKILFYNKSANFVLHPDIDDSIFNYRNNSIQYRFCYLSDLLNPVNNFIENDKFTIQMKGMLFFESSAEDRRNHSLTLGQYLWERDDRDFIISVGKKNELKTEVKIHKLILASRSSVFDRMLENEMKEKAENKLEIIDFNAEIVKIAVEYFYDRKTYKTCNVDQLNDLLQFAEKYDIQDLKSEVEHVLIIKVRPNNICQISNASVNANSTKLKEVCIQLILFYMNQRLPFNEEITLDEDFVVELNLTAALSVEKNVK